MVEALRESGERIKKIGSLLWRCFYSVSLTLLGVVGLVFIPQGAESLRLVSQPGWNFPLFLVSLSTWSLAAWYCSRLTLGRVFEGTSAIDRSNTAFVNGLRLLVPRLLGVLPAGAVAVQFFRLGAPVEGVGCLAASVALGVFMVKRRDWFASRFTYEPGESASVRFAALQQRTVFTVLSAISLSFTLLFAIWWKPVEVTAYVTAPVLLCFALASWIMFGDLVLTYFFKQAKLPSMAALPLLMFVVFSLWNDNHAIDLIEQDQGPVVRREIDSHLNAWLWTRAEKGELKPGRPFPVFLVASEGGGIRAAYWAGIVLGRLQDDSAGGFGRHLFALSGVSGGSLGNSAFAALVADDVGGALAAAPCARSNPRRPYQQCIRDVLRRDYLSPALGYLLYPDMLQRFVPFAMPAADRARAMEKGWAHGWRHATGSERMARRFDSLWEGDTGLDVPSLLLNATLVDGGNRVIASDLIVDGRFPDAYDAFDAVLDLRQMSLATAVHNSARFSYMSPAGTAFGCGSRARMVACTEHAKRFAWGRLIDGGYFENSGVETVRDLLFAMRPVLAAWNAQGFRIEPVVLVISNSPGAMAPSGRQHPSTARLDMTFLSELLAPPLGLFNTRFARATFAVTAERRDMGVLLPGDRERFLWFGMQTDNYTPLGWALADSTFNGMDGLLKRPLVDKLPFTKVLERLPTPP